MVSVGRLIVLRTTLKADLMRAMALLVWPALTAPLLDPAIGGYLTLLLADDFFVNLPLGVIAFGLSLVMTPNLKTDEQKPFDWVGFSYASGLWFRRSSRWTN
jgi:hypothetical protein